MYPSAVLHVLSAQHSPGASLSRLSSCVSASAFAPACICVSIALLPLLSLVQFQNHKLLEPSQAIVHELSHGLQDYLCRHPQLMTSPSSAASGSRSVSCSQSCHQENALHSGLQPQDSTAACLTASSGHQKPAVGLSAGTAAQPRPADANDTVVLEPVPCLADEVLLKREQQGLLERPQGKGSTKLHRAAPSPPGMPDLAATMQLLHQIDLETAGHAASSQLPTMLQSDVASQQPSLENHAAAGNESCLLDSAETAGLPEHWHTGSSASLAQADAVQGSEKEEAQELSGSSQQEESPQQQADSAEKQSQQHPEVHVLAAEETESTQSREAQDSLTGGSHDAASWGMQEQASYELEGKFSAGQCCVCLYN